MPQDTMNTSDRLRPATAAEIAEAARLFGQTDDITVVTVEFAHASAPILAPRN